MMITRRFFYLAAFLVWLFVGGELFANLPETYGFGATRIGMAGAGMVYSNDWTSPYYNIAGLASPPLFRRKGGSIGSGRRIRIKRSTKTECKPGQGGAPCEVKEIEEQRTAPIGKSGFDANDIHSQVGLGYNYQYPMMDLTLDESSYPVTTSDKLKDNLREDTKLATDGMNHGMLNLGLVFDIRNLVDPFNNMPVRLGVALAMNDDSSAARLTDLNQDVYNFKKLGRESQRLSTSIGSSWQVWRRRLSIGLGTNTVAVTKGNIIVSDAQLALEGKQPTSQAKVDAKTVSAFVFGIQYRQPLTPTQTLSVGLAGWQETFFKSDLELETGFELGEGSNALVGSAVNKQAMIAFYTPNRAVLGLGYAHSKMRLKTAVDIEFQQWSGFFLSETRKLSEDAPNFKDVILVRAGAEKGLGKSPLSVRLGGGFIPAFTPDQTGNSNYLDNGKILMATGLSYILGKNKALKVPTKFDLGIQFQLWQTRTTTKTTNTNLQPNYSYGGKLLIISLSVGWVM